MSTYRYNLPPVAVPICIGDLYSYLSKSKSTTAEGGGAIRNVRVCGLVDYYDPVIQLLRLIEPPTPGVTQAKGALDEMVDAQFLDKIASLSLSCSSAAITTPSMTNNKSESVLVDTSLIGSFDFHCRKGTSVLCVGELQTWSDSRSSAEDYVKMLYEMSLDKEDGFRTGGDVESDGVVVKATLCKLFEDLDYGRYRQYVEIVRCKNSTQP